LDLTLSYTMSTATKRSLTPKAGAESPKPETKKDDDSRDKAETGKSGGGKGWMIKVAVAVICMFAAYKFLGSQINVKEGLEKAVDFVEKQGNTAVYWYVGFTFFGVICLVPTTPMEVAGGFLFSAQYGMWIYVFTGCTKICANIVSVLIARYVVRDWVMNNVFNKFELLQMVASAVKDEPWKMAFLVRGSMVPLFVKNYGLGVTEIALIPNACCSVIFSNFYAAQNIYLGSTMLNLKEVFAPKTAVDGPKDWTQIAKALMPVFFNVLLVVFLVKAVKSQIKKQKEQIQKKLEEKTNKKSD